MNLQTKLKLSKSGKPIDYRSRLLLLGSCFADNMVEKFRYYQFLCLGNPLGILFHPKAVESLISRAADQKRFTAEDLFYFSGRWHSYEAHSDLSHPDQQTVLSVLNSAVGHTHQSLGKATHIILTLGTAWVYELRSTGIPVANCHKVPQREFAKRLLTVDEIVRSLESIVKRIRRLNKVAQLLLTVSPVRHLKDGFVENQRSKAHLLSAVHQLRDSHDSVSYFPAYEIVMDELRDYRFYESDMVHPNRLAIDYVWERFGESWISGESAPVMQKVAEIRKGLGHRPFDPESDAHKTFLKSVHEKIAYLKQEYPFMEFQVES